MSNNPNVAFFIDGFNVYHFLKNNGGKKWLNYMKLCKRLLPGSNIQSVKYFTARATWSAQKTQRHDLFIRAQKDAGVEVIINKFQQKTKRIILKNKFGGLNVSFFGKTFFGCFHEGYTQEEKQTDVAIGVQMYRTATWKNIDTIALISGDTDFIPALEAIKNDFPNINIIIFIPAKSKQYRIPPQLRALAGIHNCRFLKNKHLNKSLFPSKITLRDGSILNCPRDWL